MKSMIDDSVLGILFVVDSADKDRLDEAQQLLDELMCQNELLKTPLVIVANKQDKEGACFLCYFHVF